jgi:hypothetical protein
MSSLLHLSDRPGDPNELREQAISLNNEEMEDRSAGWLAGYANG